MYGSLPRGRNPYYDARQINLHFKQNTKRNRGLKVRPRFFIYAQTPQLAAAAAATVVARVGAAAAATVIRRKQDDENDKDQKTVIPATTAEVHRCSSFPGGLKAAVSFAFGALITSYVRNKNWFMIFRKTAYTNLTGKKKGGSAYAVYLFISKPAGL